MSGTLIAIGVGPGDIDLLTVKAMDALLTASVVAYIHAIDKPGLAIEMVRGVLKDDVVEVPIPVPMSAPESERRAAYDAALPALRAHLEAGCDVAFICEGDALFYGSFQYVQDRLSDTFQTSIIPGVTSISASAAAAGMGLVRGDEVFQALPAPLSDGALAAHLSDSNSAFAILKLGRHMARVKALLSRLGRLDTAVLVEKATWEDERVVALKAFNGEAAYFAQILIPAQTPAIDASQKIAIVCLNAAGLDTAQKLKAHLPEAILYGLKDRVKIASVDRAFGDVQEILRTLFQAGTPIAAIMATGIVVRAVAPLLTDKRTEPPVVALSPDGAFAVPVLGGHRGANRLAQTISQITKGFAALTTASDSALGFGLDEPPAGWTVANPEQAKAVTAKRLSGEDVGLYIESGTASWLTGFQEGRDILVTHREIDLPGKTLVLHPPTLSLGVGCERNCSADELAELVDRTLTDAGLSKSSIACVSSIDLKSDEAAILDLANSLGVPARFFSAAALSAQTPRLKNPSSIVEAEVGCAGVSEGAALACVGEAGTLLVEKHKSKHATCALGLSPLDIAPLQQGQSRGRLFILGIGPGTPAWRTPEVTRILSAVSDVVGYGFYLDLVQDLIAGKHHHSSDLAQEEARVRKALDLAAQGKDVALISSGDVGIYAMAALAFELLDREDRADWNRLYIQVEPGISAFQAAAARMGAPNGHDFCLISLSDLLTPWAVIERRLKAAAMGGFTVSLYNPVSKRRRSQITAARDILLTHRPPDTPVILARQLGRADEHIQVIALADLTPDHADMLTLVMVGGEDTRTLKRGQNTWVYTPRGYANKKGETP